MLVAVVCRPVPEKEPCGGQCEHALWWTHTGLPVQHLATIGLFVHVFFPCASALCSYWFVFFKMQTTAYALLPTENRHDGKDFFEYWGVNFKDPRSDHLAVGHANFGGLPARLQAVHHGGLICGLGARARPDPQSPFPISAWRSIFVANEWAELQTTRRTSVHFILFWLGFFLVGMGLEHNATARPRIDRNDFTPGHHNIALRFVNTTFFWLASFYPVALELPHLPAICFRAGSSKFY